MATSTSNQPQSAAPAKLAPEDNNKYMRQMNVSVGNNRSNDYKPTKTSGIKIRGTGAATKGVMARGPMA